MTADLFLNDEGELVRFSLYPALIRSDARLSYGEADDILIDYKAAIAAGGDIAWRLVECSRLARAREAARARAGGIDFATTEAKVVLDAEGRPTDIALAPQDRCHAPGGGGHDPGQRDGGRLPGAARLSLPVPRPRTSGLRCLGLGSFPCSRNSIGSKGPWRRVWWREIRRSSRRF